MGWLWAPAMRAAEQAGCVVSASRASQPDEGLWSCSGVILNRSTGLVLCHGRIFTPFLRAGSRTLTAADVSFLPADSCDDDLRLHVQWGSTTANPAGCARQGRPVLCTPKCAGPEAGLAALPRGRPLSPPRPAELLLLLSCPAFRAQFARLYGGDAAEQWRFASLSPEDEVWDNEENLLRAMGWFALLRVQPEPAAAQRNPAECGVALTVAPLGTVAKGAPLLACGSPFGTFCPDIFLNTLSRGVLSNTAGPLLLTDARCLPGTEGGGVFLARPSGALVALVASPFCWKGHEWVGLTLLCAAAPLLQVARAALAHLRLCAASLATQLPREMRAPRGLLLQDPAEPTWAAAAVLVECGSSWGSGVAVAPRLVLTCRHVVPREKTRVLVCSSTPRRVAIWGQVVFATHEVSPYDIAVVMLEKALDGVPTPVLAEQFHEGEAVSVVGYGIFGQACGPLVTSGILSAVVHVDDTPVMLQTTCAVHGGSSGGPLFSTDTGNLLGIVASNTRDNSTGATYPHLNYSIPITVLRPALQRYHKTGDLSDFHRLDSAAKAIRVVWQLQQPLTESPKSKL
ncbi:PREDICTED: peroxisomal leader peptide-processing protease [Elephantulus edwardii]|uniref:peroxisomal leader peptide-processing protease n=1 Tax=Elephantulus edwardii TaxID=28737 RepID=UPI0003F0C3FE|nr:PREDICTED: peroxisomal leader peptide-processing protease [Elephantulus edwardii]